MTNPQTDALEPHRETAYQLYLNEITPNGESRIDNMITCLRGNDFQQRHFMSQVDMAFQAAWHHRPAEQALKARVAELEAAQEVDEADLDRKMAAAGMIPLTQLLSKPPTPFSVHAAVHTMDDFYWWIAMKHKEFLMMRMRYEVGDRDKGDELYEWVFVHSAVFGAIHDHLRASMPLPPTPVKE